MRRHLVTLTLLVWLNPSLRYPRVGSRGLALAPLHNSIRRLTLDTGFLSLKSSLFKLQKKRALRTDLDLLISESLINEGSNIQVGRCIGKTLHGKICIGEPHDVEKRHILLIIGWIVVRCGSIFRVFPSLSTKYYSVQMSKIISEANHKMNDTSRERCYQSILDCAVCSQAGWDVSTVWVSKGWNFVQEVIREGSIPLDID